jgi:hypothetical protein
MEGLFSPIPDGSYELKFIAEDKERDCVAAFAVFSGTNTGPGGPPEPTGKSTKADYVYTMQFEGDLIKHMTKICNDTIDSKKKWWPSLTRTGDLPIMSRRVSLKPHE